MLLNLPFYRIYSLFAELFSKNKPFNVTLYAMASWTIESFPSGILCLHLHPLYQQPTTRHILIPHPKPSIPHPPTLTHKYIKSFKNETLFTLKQKDNFTNTQQHKHKHIETRQDKNSQINMAVAQLNNLYNQWIRAPAADDNNKWKKKLM